ncbi:MAG: VCBS repeat-containing protein [Chloroflexota bacterium]
MSSVLVLLYRCCLHLFSPHFQQEFADEIEEVFKEQLELAAANGSFALLAFFLRELSGLIGAGIRQRAYAWQARPLLAAQTGSSVVVADRGSLWGNKALKWGALLLLIGMLLFLAFWIYMFFFFSFERPPRVQEIALGDLNGDGQLDAYLAIAPDGEPYVHPDYLLFNVGNGRFTDSRQDFGDASSFSVALGDVNGDGLLDIVVSGYGVKVYRNYDSGAFRGRYSVGDGQDGIYRFDVVLADLNRDGHLDVFGAGCCGGGIPGKGGMQQVFYPTSRAWLGNGAGTFSTTGQSLGQLGSQAVALADLNGDGALDAFLANSSRMDASGNAQRGVPNTIWFNDGQGNFTDSGQQLGNEESYAVDLGDVNGDGFLDAVVGNRGSDKIWFNDGRGNFSDSGQRLGRGLTRAIFLAGLDDDSDLDLVTAGEESAQVWLNDGAGQFSQGQRISYNQYEAIALGDVTGDGIVDIFVAGVESYQVWRGMGDGRFSADPRTVFMAPQP